MNKPIIEPSGHPPQSSTSITLWPNSYSGVVGIVEIKIRLVANGWVLTDTDGKEHIIKEREEILPFLKKMK